MAQSGPRPTRLGGELLFLAHRVPYPPNKGDKIRSYNELKFLAERGWRVHLCALADDPADLGYLPELERLCETVTLEPLSPRFQRIKSVRGPLTALPLSVPYFYRSALQRRVDELLADRPLEAMMCFCSPMAQYVFRSRTLPASDRQRADVGASRLVRAPLEGAASPRQPSATPFGRLGQGARPRLVMDLVDVDSDKWTQYSRFQRWPMSWVYRMEGVLLAHYEARLARTFDAVALVSPAEAELFGRRCALPEKVHAVGNGVDLDFFHPTSEPPGSPKGLVFCGAMDYFPNADAVVWFAREVLPLMREAAGDVSFTVVGSKPTEEVRALADLPGVRVTGRVDDVRPYVWEAGVSVAPIRIARGVQNKVLEAMAMARPVVATPQAFEGIDAEPGRDLLVADADPRAFSACALGLLADAGGAEALGRRARAAMMERYAWGAQLAKLEELIRS